MKTAAPAENTGVVDCLGNDGYAANFGLQWNEFQLTQFDSYSGLSISRDRLVEGTQWGDIAGLKVLEAGCGAGRFTEVLLSLGADLTAVDMSSAVFANYRNNHQKGQARFYRASILDLPFEPNSFDRVICYGVLQHIPEPEKAFRSLWGLVKPGGKLAIDWYRFTPYPTPSTTKYIWRPLTTRMNPETLLRFVRWYVPRWLPVDTFIRKLPAGKLLKALTFVPCANYYDLDLAEDAKVSWAVLDTFDSLGARYDKPRSRKGMLSLLDGLEGVASWDLRKGPNGWVMNFSKVS